MTSAEGRTRANSTSIPVKTLVEPRIDDELVEVVGIRDSLHVALINFKIQHGVRLAQGKHIIIRTKGPLPFQVDGEPWGVRENCEIHLDRRNQAVMMTPHRDVPSFRTQEVLSVCSKMEHLGLMSPEASQFFIREYSRRFCKDTLDPNFYGENADENHHHHQHQHQHQKNHHQNRSSRRNDGNYKHYKTHHHPQNRI